MPIWCSTSTSDPAIDGPLFKRFMLGHRERFMLGHRERFMLGHRERFMLGHREMLDR